MLNPPRCQGCKIRKNTIKSHFFVYNRIPSTGNRINKISGAKTCQIQKLEWLGEKDEGFTTEEEQEEAICHTAEAQDASLYFNPRYISRWLR